MNIEFNLANDLCLQGNYEEALEMFNLVYEMRISFFGSNHFYTTDSQNLIGRIFKKLIYESALKVRIQLKNQKRNIHLAQCLVLFRLEEHRITLTLN